MKKCAKCEQLKPLSAFWREAGKPDGRKARCIECIKSDQAAYRKSHRREMVESTQRWKRNNPDRARLYMKEIRQNLKEQVFYGYGGRCTCCGEDEFAFLTLEHLNGDGKAHRKARGGSLGTYRDVLKQGYPNTYTVLCMNCNYAKKYGKTCPHQQTAALKLAGAA